MTNPHALFAERTDLVRAKDVLGRIARLRGDAPSSMMTAGTPGDVNPLRRNLIEKVGRDGGIILDGAIGIPDEARTVNARALFEAVRRYAP